MESINPFQPIIDYEIQPIPITNTSKIQVIVCSGDFLRNIEVHPTTPVFRLLNIYMGYIDSH